MNSKKKAKIIFRKVYDQGQFLVFDDKPNIRNLLELEQVHGNTIIEINQSLTADGILITNDQLRDFTPVIKTADCLPILYLANDHVALIHAGWRGLQKGIHIHKDLKKFDFNKILIGPSISAKNFEVGEEFRDFFPESPYFSEITGKLTFNLQEFALNQLRECFPLAIIETSDICTFSNSDFNSYRRNKTKTRNWNIFLNKE